MRNDEEAACNRGGMAIDPLALDTSVPALIQKVGTYPSHHGGLGVVHSVGRVGVPWQSDAEDPDRFLVGERLGRPTVLIPTDDLGFDARLERLACFMGVKLRPYPPYAGLTILSRLRAVRHMLRRRNRPFPGAPTPRYVPVGRGGRP
jgi:hypothetical protein